MEKEMFDTIKEKSFSQLTESERKQVGKLCKNEKEYNSLKRVLWTAQSSKTKLSNAVKSNLDKSFIQLYGAKKFYQTVSFKVAATIAIVTVLTIPFLVTKEQVKEIKISDVSNTNKSKKKESLKQEEQQLVKTIESDKEARTEKPDKQVIKISKAERKEEVNQRKIAESQALKEVMTAEAPFADSDGIYKEDTSTEDFKERSTTLKESKDLLILLE